ncbi:MULTISPECIES: hypothetical protein [unclassified Lysobacter]|uniref:hypothetical protein n=1 Tax=unclassified Lysobacter TaxID=2635362 RepID=UPI001BE9CAFE|nr:MULTISPECIES: hypothetical protein [unclassified Lysobacter]MBT2748262.1 hypothetical protein [Lysobacter sp. ISL-42]MBT2749971.1 hypothetical protein [Lysobacter sp. ISL-50]MBT2781299.1 hypothetical protein [Lysobacter sp. ISL-52]
MLFKRFLRWFEREPVDALMPVDESDGTNNLLVLGALNTPRRTIRVQCMDCHLGGVRQSYMHGDHGLRCTKCGGVVELGATFQSVQINREWLPRALTQQMARADQLPTMLIENRLWRLAYLKTKAGRVPVYLVRCGWDVIYDQTSDVLRSENGTRQIVLTTSTLLDGDLAEPDRFIVPLMEVAKLETEGLWLNVERLAELVSTPPPLWFRLTSNADRLILGDEELLLRRGQRRFFRGLAEAHGRGMKRVSTDSLLRRSKYRGKYTSLHQLMKPEFFRFIDHKNGEVWIRKDVVPAKSEGEADES